MKTTYEQYADWAGTQGVFYWSPRGYRWLYEMSQWTSFIGTV